MTRIRLELDHLQVHRPKKRWRLYFVIAADHPTEADKMVVTVMPQNTVPVFPDQNNHVVFQDSSPGANGLFVLSRPMPSSREMNVHVHVMHSRRTVNEIGKVLTDIETGIGKGAMGLLTGILGAANPWLAITRQALPIVGQIMEKIPDRYMGFLTTFERFDKEFETDTEIDREARGGHITIVYSWSVDQEE